MNTTEGKVILSRTPPPSLTTLSHGATKSLPNNKENWVSGRTSSAILQKNPSVSHKSTRSPCLSESEKTIHFYKSSPMFVRIQPAILSSILSRRFLKHGGATPFTTATAPGGLVGECAAGGFAAVGGRVATCLHPRPLSSSGREIPWSWSCREKVE